MVTEVHREYVAAGCDVLTTNTFVLTPDEMSKVGRAADMPSLLHAAAACAQAAGCDRIMLGLKMVMTEDEAVACLDPSSPGAIAAAIVGQLHEDPNNDDADDAITINDESGGGGKPSRRAAAEQEHFSQVVSTCNSYTTIGEWKESGDYANWKKKIQHRAVQGASREARQVLFERHYGPAAHELRPDAEHFWCLVRR